MRKLADNYRIVVAAPDYLERRGTPVVPEDLMGHECLLYRVPETHWSLVGPGGKAAELRVACRLRCNSGEVAHDWALAGCGLSPDRVAQRAHAGLRPLPLKPATASPRAPLPRRHGRAACRCRSAAAPLKDFVIAGGWTALMTTCLSERRQAPSAIPTIETSNDRLDSRGENGGGRQWNRQPCTTGTLAAPCTNINITGSSPKVPER